MLGTGLGDLLGECGEVFKGVGTRHMLGKVKLPNEVGTSNRSLVRSFFYSEFKFIEDTIVVRM